MDNLIVELKPVIVENKIEVPLKNTTYTNKSLANDFALMSLSLLSSIVLHSAALSATAISNAIFKVVSGPGEIKKKIENFEVKENLELEEKEESFEASENLELVEKEENFEASENLELEEKEENFEASENLELAKKEDTSAVSKKLTLEGKEDTNEVKVINISFMNNGEKEKDLNFLNKTRPNDIGHILVIPQDSDAEIFRIPFEFMPEIKEGSYTAQYNAQNVLARVGSIQNFSHTELSTPSITAKYYAISDGKSDATDPWMKTYTLETIQKIQRMYEALVMPRFPKSEEDSINDPFSYRRPPFVKIIIGNEKTTLFTYPLRDTDVKSDTINKGYKSYLVTSVSIEKDLTEPLVMENGKIIDTFGFTVSLDLLEVTKSYMDMYPDYDSYFNSFTSVISKDPFKA